MARPEDRFNFLLTDVFASRIDRRELAQCFKRDLLFRGVQNLWLSEKCGSQDAPEVGVVLRYERHQEASRQEGTGEIEMLEAFDECDDRAVKAERDRVDALEALAVLRERSAELETVLR